MRITHIAFAVVLTQLVAQNVSADSPTNEVRAVFESFVMLERKFDPAAADLYADEAILRHTRHLSNRTTRLITLPASKFKPLMRETMPVAKQHNDTSLYTNVVVKQEGEKVRLTCTRYSELKRYTGRFTVVFANQGGKWQIVEEISESRP